MKETAEHLMCVSDYQCQRVTMLKKRDAMIHTIQIKYLSEYKPFLIRKTENLSYQRIHQSLRRT